VGVWEPIKGKEKGVRSWYAGIRINKREEKRERWGHLVLVYDATALKMEPPIPCELEGKRKVVRVVEFEAELVARPSIRSKKNKKQPVLKKI